jgi:hypothetical protein
MDTRPNQDTLTQGPRPAAFRHGNLTAQRATASNSSAVRVRGSPGATVTAPLVGIAMKAGYRQAFETTNESVRIKF